MEYLIAIMIFILTIEFAPGIFYWLRDFYRWIKQKTNLTKENDDGL